jgi:hypothetical protein
MITIAAHQILVQRPMFLSPSSGHPFLILIGSVITVETFLLFNMKEYGWVRSITLSAPHPLAWSVNPTLACIVCAEDSL